MSKKRVELSPGALTAPLPPVLVTVGDAEESNVLTVAWTGILATKPPRTYVSIRPSRHSYGLLSRGGEFVINLPTADMARRVDFAGIYTGAKVDKFEKCGFTKVRSDRVAPPIIAECPVALECRVFEMREMGTHHVFFADIVGVSCSEDIIDGDGRLCFDRANLLAYAHGEYYALGEVIGRFGFSTDKQKRTAAPADAPKRDGAADEGAEDRAAEPFYKNAPRAKARTRSATDKNKGRPHKKGGAPKK